MSTTYPNGFNRYEWKALADMHRKALRLGEAEARRTGSTARYDKAVDKAVAYLSAVGYPQVTA